MRTKSGEADSRYRALIELLRTADTLWDASRVFFARWDLSPSQFNILNLLRLSPDGLSQSDLSRELLTHRSNVTGLIDRLEQRGLVTRNDAAGDRRAYSLALTPAGSALLRQILPGYFKNATAVWGGISDRRAEELAACLRQIASNARQIAGADR
jgi:DNA-binding MarR family transcriptional regulator